MIISPLELIEGLDNPFKVYAGKYGFIGGSSAAEFADEIKRRGLEKLVPVNSVLPTFTILLTTIGQMNLQSQDVLIGNIVKRLPADWRKACVVEFVSRTELPVGYTLRINRRVLALEAGLATGGRSVLTLQSASTEMELMETKITEELHRFMSGGR